MLLFTALHNHLSVTKMPPLRNETERRLIIFIVLPRLMFYRPTPVYIGQINLIEETADCFSQIQEKSPPQGFPAGGCFCFMCSGAAGGLSAAKLRCPREIILGDGVKLIAIEDVFYHQHITPSSALKVRSRRGHIQQLPEPVGVGVYPVIIA